MKRRKWALIVAAAAPLLLLQVAGLNAREGPVGRVVCQFLCGKYADILYRQCCSTGDGSCEKSRTADRTPTCELQAARALHDCLSECDISR